MDTPNATSMTRDPHHLERVRINFSWLLKLRWAAAAGQLATILWVKLWIDIELPMLALCAILAFEGISNIVLAGWFRGILQRDHEGSEERRVETVLGSIMLLDIFLLTLLLFLTGGPTNPFSIFFMVNIVLAAVVLNAAWSIWISAIALVCFAGLFLFHFPLDELALVGHESGARRGASPLAGSPTLYLEGLLVAFVAAASVISVFVIRLNGELAQLERELLATQQRKARSERLEALGTLSAGTAHELASPLSTIAVVARDLELSLAKIDPRGEATEDARLIRQEVARCRSILDLMAVEAGQSTGEPLVDTSLDELLDDVLQNVKRRDHVELRIEPAARKDPLRVPKRALALALRQIVKNGLDAAAEHGPVKIRVGQENGHLRFSISDPGPGMSAEIAARATDPFFTTKEPGQGMGLGLYLTKSVVDRLDGQISFQPGQKHGTTVDVTLPLHRLRTTPQEPA